MYNDKIYSGKISQNIYFNNKDIYLKLVIFQLFNSYDILYGLKSDFVEDFLRVKILLILNITNLNITNFKYQYTYIDYKIVIIIVIIMIIK